MIVLTMTSNSQDSERITTYEIVVEQLQSVFDPEFPLVDIYTM